MAALAGGGWVWVYNRLVAEREAVDAAWAQVESSYQRRADLIPGLVEAVERHMKYESETLERVVDQRGEALRRFALAARGLGDAQSASQRALESLGGAPPESEEELVGIARAQAQVAQGIRQMLAISEDYPELRSADHFLELQAQLEGTENRIHVARIGFNERVRAYNAALEQIPTRLIAESKGYQRRAYFETEEKHRSAAPLGFH